MNEIYPLIVDNRINYAKAYGTLSGLFISIKQGYITNEEALDIYDKLYYIVSEQEKLNRQDVARN